MKNFFLILALLGLYSCDYESGKIKVVNKVHNVKLENINWGTYSVAYSLLTGEESSAYEVVDDEGKFPKANCLEFYMVSSGKRVYLKTKSKYQLNADQTITIEICDSTSIINPSL